MVVVIFAFLVPFVIVGGSLIYLFLIGKLSRQRVHDTIRNLSRDLQRIGIESTVLMNDRAPVFLHDSNKELGVGTGGYGNLYDLTAICTIQNQNIDYAFFSGMNPYGFLFPIFAFKIHRFPYPQYLDYAINNPTSNIKTPNNQETINATVKPSHIGRLFGIPVSVQLVTKRMPVFERTVAQVRWKGNRLLSQVLNEDGELNQMLVSRFRKQNKMKALFIYYSQEHAWAIIRTPDFLPDGTDFTILDKIAEHVKTTWFGVQ